MTALVPDAERAGPTEHGGMPTNVLIAGGGPAALEAALALHRQAGERVATTLLAPELNLTYRPLSVLSPFAAGGVPTYPLQRIADDAAFAHARGRLARVDATEHVAVTVEGERLSYDVLIVASGARPVEPFQSATMFTGSVKDQECLHGIVQDVEEGYLKRLAFVVPTGSTWPLPLYELSLMLAERAFEMCASLELHLLTPEKAPLELFGAEASREVSKLLAEAGVILHAGTDAEVLAGGRLRVVSTGDVLEVDRLVTLPRLEGPNIAGLPANPEGFLVIDGHARVQGVPDVYAAGDVTAFPIKQGGIACQQADAAAADIAKRAGAPVEAEPFTTVLRGMLLTERWARFLRQDPAAAAEATDVAGRALWWPPTKIAGRELAGYLEGLDEEAGRSSGLSVNVDIGDEGTGGVEVLSLH
jgi:sulfide:quinone oxidoreductase